MNRRFVKSLIVSFVSLMLLYYGAAWAMLRCLHDDDHSTTPVQISETGARIEATYAQSRSEDPGDLACIGFDYHAESLAGPSSSSQLQRWAALIVAHVTGFSIPDGIAAGGARIRSLRAVFDGIAYPVYLLDLPRYLSLSALRI